ncbi:MAG TPA: DUF2231 domain-containing protein [Jatrophihabitantaceae bacterium]|jgi:uncharacterized membrane protein|nr:DUF2231 domain-containing protein [Jatrophihabitantaceae bacterium]
MTGVQPLRDGIHPRSRLAGPYGHPTHPALVTIPIGAWTASLIFDIASHIAGNPAFLARGSVWLIAIGVVGALLAAIAGFLDLLAIPVRSAPFRIALIHMTLNVAVVLAYVGNFAWREANHDTLRAVPAGPLVLSVISLGVLGASGYLGGMLAYRYGVRVAREHLVVPAQGVPAAPAERVPADVVARDNVPPV